jgi:hypothetical protein
MHLEGLRPPRRDPRHAIEQLERHSHPPRRCAMAIEAQIASLLAAQKENLNKRREIRKQIKAARRKAKRLRQKARGLSEAELLELLVEKRASTDSAGSSSGATSSASAATGSSAAAASATATGAA